MRLYFPVLELWVTRSALLPTICPVYLCVNVGPRGATSRSACPVLCHSESGSLGLSARMWDLRVCQWSDCLPRSSHTLPVSVLPWPRQSSPPLCPSPPLLPVWMYVSFLSTWCWTSLPFDFLSVGCARRRSVSTYAAILVPSKLSYLIIMYLGVGLLGFILLGTLCTS